MVRNGGPSAGSLATLAALVAGFGKQYPLVDLNVHVTDGSCSDPISLVAEHDAVIDLSGVRLHSLHPSLRPPGVMSWALATGIAGVKFFSVSMSRFDIPNEEALRIINPDTHIFRLPTVIWKDQPGPFGSLVENGGPYLEEKGGRRAVLSTRSLEFYGHLSQVGMVLELGVWLGVPRRPPVSVSPFDLASSLVSDPGLLSPQAVSGISPAGTSLWPSARHDDRVHWVWYSNEVALHLLMSETVPHLLKNPDV